MSDTTSSSPSLPAAAETKQFEMPSVLERFESKYTVPLSMVDRISAFIEPYCSLDRHSAITPGNFYRVNSLYFDTPQFLFLQQRMRKVEKRFNMRVRSYGDHPVMPWFLEIKQRRGDVIRKFRSRLGSGDLKEVLFAPGPMCLDDDNEKQLENRELFRRTAHRYNSHPVVLVQYQRKAYAGDYDDYARVTFDIGLRYMAQSDYSPVPRETEMTPCDVQGCFDAGCSVILELKCYTSYVPLWMVDLVKTFNLKRRSFSKYANCVRPLLLRFSDQEGFLRRPVIADSFHEEE